MADVPLRSQLILVDVPAGAVGVQFASSEDRLRHGRIVARLVQSAPNRDIVRAALAAYAASQGRVLRDGHGHRGDDVVRPDEVWFDLS